jgi:phage anti-repressor protein
MNDIINNTSKQTPIEIALGIDENGYTTARALYDFLDMPKQNFARWAKKNIEENEYFEETVDWWGFFTMKNGNECKDYRLTTDFAKHLSMESHSAKGKIARQYFLKVEDKLKEAVRRTVPMTIPEQIQLLAQGTVELNQRVDTLDRKLERLEYDLPVLPVEADRITEAVKKKGTAVLGGKLSNAYKSRSIRQKVYSNIHSNLRYQFQVKSYKSIKRNQVDKAVDIIGRYEPPVFLQNEIDSENAQETMF